MTLRFVEGDVKRDDFIEQFERDIGRHVMEVFRDDGVNRHIRYRRPGTMCMHFDLITWPGYLCYTGDMGTYVFTRLEDMFEFFRRSEADRKYRIDMRYWAEKCRAADRDGIDEFSPDAFRANVREHFEYATDDPERWPEARKAALWEEIAADVLGDLHYLGEHGAWAALAQFSFDGFCFQDWERDCKEYTFRFQWCCYALAWAIDQYDQAKSSAPALTAAPL